MSNQLLLPKTWAKPRGYAQGIIASGNMIFISGQPGWDEEYKLISDDYPQQVRRSLQNILCILNEAGSSSHNIVQLTWYITDKNLHLSHTQEVGLIYREIINNYNVTMNMIQVAALMVEGALLQIDAIAVV